jgi:uncharacterized protein YndB with AHSA1/START domain
MSVSSRNSPLALTKEQIMTTITVHQAIKGDADTIWGMLVDGSITPMYYVGFAADFDLTPGAPYRYTAGGGDMITGVIVEVDPGRKLVTTFRGLWDAAIAELPESTVTFLIGNTAMPTPGVTLLTCVHEGLPDSPLATHLELGWVSILSGLKTVVETGAPMVGAPS